MRHECREKRDVDEIHDSHKFISLPVMLDLDYQEHLLNKYLIVTSPSHIRDGGYKKTPIFTAEKGRHTNWVLSSSRQPGCQFLWPVALRPQITLGLPFPKGV